MGKVKEKMPVVVGLNVRDENGHMILVADGLEDAAKNYPSIKMTPREKATWQKRLKNIIESNEYYKKYC